MLLQLTVCGFDEVIIQKPTIRPTLQAPNTYYSTTTTGTEDKKNNVNLCMTFIIKLYD